MLKAYGLRTRHGNCSTTPSPLEGESLRAEFMNEPTYAAMGGAPKGYDAAKLWPRHCGFSVRSFGKTSPDTIFLGPGSVARDVRDAYGQWRAESEDLLPAAGPVFDVFSYHLYAGCFEAMRKHGASSQTTAAAGAFTRLALAPGKIGAFYADLRDRFESGKSLWITETADAACGGNPWASTFLDTFRYLIQHASLAQRGGKSDYAQHAGVERLRNVG